MQPIFQEKSHVNADEKTVNPLHSISTKDKAFKKPNDVPLPPTNQTASIDVQTKRRAKYIDYLTQLIKFNEQMRLTVDAPMVGDSSKK